MGVGGGGGCCCCKEGLGGGGGARPLDDDDAVGFGGGGGGAKLIEFSLNGYCIVNHFYEDIRKYLEKVFPNMIFKLEFGNNYKSITMSMSSLFTRNAIQKYSKIGVRERDGEGGRGSEIRGDG